MSFVSGFRFTDFACDFSRYVPHPQLGAMSLSLMTPHDCREMSVVVVNTPHQDCDPNFPWSTSAKSQSAKSKDAVTLFDARMGNLDISHDVKKACTTCAGQSASGTYPRCVGHFGLIELPIPTYHPLLIRDLVRLLRTICWSCFRYRGGEGPGEALRTALGHADSGDIAESERFLSEYQNLVGAVKASDMARQEGLVNADVSDGGGDDDNGSVAEQVDEKDDADSDTPLYLAHERRKKKIDAPNARGSKGALRDIHQRMKILKDFMGRSSRGTCAHCKSTQPKDIRIQENLIFFSYPANPKGVMESNLAKWEDETKFFKRKLMWLRPEDASKIVESAFKADRELYAAVFAHIGEASACPPCATRGVGIVPPSKMHEVFFMPCVMVPPNTFRSFRVLDRTSSATVDTCTEKLSSIIIHAKAFGAFKEETNPEHRIGRERTFRQLQMSVNALITMKVAAFTKKEGLFRNNMMGKRVNQACRSVISPDGYIEVNELCLPRRFATRLTFPDSMRLQSGAHTEFLMQCIRNGTKAYPGATHVEVTEANGEVKVTSLLGKEGHLEKIAERMSSLIALGQDVTVHRHLIDGDAVIFNRQPTLHKPSMIGKRIMVRGNDYTMRFQYASCKGFNADFDGDEMNCHVLQGMGCKAEVATLMDADLMYLVPSSGRPIRGLIQDHVVGAMLLTVRGTYLNRSQFTTLVYAGLHPMNVLITLPTPCILKPQPLWSGKQVISEILKHVTGVYGGKGDTKNEGLNMKTRSSTPGHMLSMHPHDLEDGTVIILKSEVLQGVIDKAQIGASGNSMCHFVHEIYGARATGQLFGALVRMLSEWCRIRGFSLTMNDIFVRDDIIDDAKKKKQRSEMLKVADNSTRGANETIALENVSEHITNMTKHFYPTNMHVLFPKNQLLAMTASGARGAANNATQMSVILGQQYFDNHRIGVMPSGKVLPGSFANDERARARGLVRGRFLSGIRPQEYFIHASAGRDGIIDTAIKTARSGYLQRCLIKGMESTVLQWDGTVRTGDDEVLQFQYGDDGLDPCKASTLNNWDFVARNLTDLRTRYAPTMAKAPHTTLRPHTRSDLKSFKFANVAMSCLQKMTPEMEAATRKEMREITKCRESLAKCDPGEAVGLIAAQSTGEPSTQMTLNTFHHAGATISHVTEGIPRLREILTFATVKEPAVVIPMATVGAAEMAAYHRIKERLMPFELYHALAPVTTPWAYRFTRNKESCRIDLRLLFSATALRARQATCGVSDCQFTEDFIQCVTDFLRLVVRQVHKDVTSSSIVMESAEVTADPIGAVSRRGGEGDDEGGGGGDDANSEDGGPADEKNNEVELEDHDDTAAPLKEEDDDADDVKPTTTPTPPMAPPVPGRDRDVTTWNRSSISVAMSKDGARVSGYDVHATGYDATKETFQVSCVLSLPANGVTVMEDVLLRCLHASTLENSSNPIDGTFTVLSIVKHKGKPSGEIVFKGTAAKLRTVLQFRPETEETTSFEWDKVTSTCPNDLAATFGIESTTEYLQHELQKIFASYSVDNRHLTVIADTVTHTGRCLGFNRNGIIQASASPLFQMTFETGQKFLHDAVLHSITDPLQSFSAALIVGQRPKVGTFFGELLQK